MQYSKENKRKNCSRIINTKSAYFFVAWSNNKKYLNKKRRSYSESI